MASSQTLILFRKRGLVSQFSAECEGSHTNLQTLTSSFKINRLKAQEMHSLLLKYTKDVWND